MTPENRQDYVQSLILRHKQRDQENEILKQKRKQERDEARARRAAREAAAQSRDPSRTQQARHESRLAKYQERVPPEILSEYNRLVSLCDCSDPLSFARVAAIRDKTRKIIESPYLLSAQKKELRRLLSLCEERVSISNQTSPLRPVSSPESRDEEGYIYVIQDVDTSLYKIGMTMDWERRSRELRVGITSKLVELRLVRNPRELEQRVHQRYKSCRLPQTEYFKLPRPPDIS